MDKMRIDPMHELKSIEDRYIYMLSHVFTNRISEESLLVSTAGTPTASLLCSPRSVQHGYVARDLSLYGIFAIGRINLGFRGAHLGSLCLLF